MVVPYPTLCPVMRLPAFYALTERFVQIMAGRVFNTDIIAYCDTDHELIDKTFIVLHRSESGDGVRLELTTFHGKVLMTEYLATESDILESVVLAQFAEKKLKLCRGRMDGGELRSDLG